MHTQNSTLPKMGQTSEVERPATKMVAKELHDHGAVACSRPSVLMGISCSHKSEYLDIQSPGPDERTQAVKQMAADEITCSKLAPHAELEASSEDPRQGFCHSS